MTEVDDDFFERADEHIHLSNEQMSKVSIGKVSASMMYGLARFNAYVSACSWTDRDGMRNAKSETIDYFIAEYKKMLEENLDDYIENYDTFMKS